MNSVTDVIILAGSITHLVLLLYALVRGNRLKTGRVWLPTAILFSGLASSAYLLPETAFPLLGVFSLSLTSTLLLVVMLSVFGSLVLTDLSNRRSLLALAIGLVWLVILIAISATGTPFIVGDPGWIAATLNASNFSGVVAIIGFSVLGMILLGRAFIAFYRAPLPETSNRALFWVLIVTTVLMGMVLATSGSAGLEVIGLVMIALGMTATTYSQVSYRVFDIRSIIGLMIRLVLLTAITAAAILGTILLLDTFDTSSPAEEIVLAATFAFLVALLYVPLREAASFLTQRLFTGRSVDPIEAIRKYSQEVSGTLDIKDLIEVASQTLNRVMKVRRSGLLLISDTTENDIEMTAMRGGGFEDAENLRGRIAKDSAVYRRIAYDQRTLSMFDIENTPEYQPVTEEARAFFQTLGMSAYAPIIIDNALIGLLACGPKINDAPFYADDYALMSAMANQTGVALRNTRLVADLRHLNYSMQAMNRSLGDANDRMGRLDSVKTDFVTIASHELRTPLAQVRGYTDILDALNGQGMLDQDQTSGLVNSLRKATERMEELISAMLDVSQLDVNAMDLRFAQTSVESVMRMAIEPLTDAIKQRKLTLSARHLSGLPPIEADMQRLVQAFRNVVVNAIKFTPDGGRIDISAEYHQSEQPGTHDYILVTISDTGVGIDPANIELIFNKFFRTTDPNLHSTGTYKFMGAGPGLGLTIAKGVIEGHGGRLWAESPGNNMKTFPGASFFIQLPIKPPKDASRVLPFEGRDGEVPDPTPKKLPEKS